MALRLCDVCVLSSCFDLSNVPKPCDREYCFDTRERDHQVEFPTDAGNTNMVHGPEQRGEIREADTMAKAKELQEARRLREEALRDTAASIDRCEEELVVLETLKQTAEACLDSVLEQAFTHNDDVPKDDDVPSIDAELVVRIYEALADDAGPTEGLDVCIQLQHAGKDSATSLRPSRSWASDTGTLAGRMGALHVTWNELFRFKASETEVGRGPDSLALAVVREDGEAIASVEVELAGLIDQKVQHQWCTIGCGWRVYFAMQFVRSAPELLRSHISEFEVRLRNAQTRLAWLRNGNDFDPPLALGHAAHARNEQRPPRSNGIAKFGGHRLPEKSLSNGEPTQPNPNKVVDLDEDLCIAPRTPRV